MKIEVIDAKAIYARGVFTPTDPVPLAEGTEVSLRIATREPESNGPGKTTQELGYAPGFFENVLGSFEDDPLFRPPPTGVQGTWRS